MAIRYLYTDRPSEGQALSLVATKVTYHLSMIQGAQSCH